jgi:hypothetical protein
VGFLEPWREYANSHRDVFLEEVLNFVRTVDRRELADIRKEVQAARAQRLRTHARRGRPRSSGHDNRVAARELRIVEAAQDKASVAHVDEHSNFRWICVECTDRPNLRPVFLQQILSFVKSAAKREIAAVGKSVMTRAKNRELPKKRGRPGVQDDKKLILVARDVAWHRYVDGWGWEQIAKAAGISVTKTNESREGNSGNVRWQLRRLEGFLAARIWEVVDPTYVVQRGQHRFELVPGSLDDKPLQHILSAEAALPFQTHPEECKKIVNALWRRALPTATQQDLRRISYRCAKTHE